MIAVSDVNRSPTAQSRLIAVIEIVQAMQIVKIPRHGCVLAIDLEEILCLMPAGVTGGFKVAKRSIGEVAKKRARIINANILHISSQRVLALLDESFGACNNAGNSAIQPLRRINAVCEQVASHS